MQVFGKPMCCSTGICGPQVDQTLVRFAGDFDWLRRQGVSVERFNLSQQPRAFAQVPTSVQKLLPRLRDAHYTRALIVTLPEATPVHEAAQLQRDLRRAGIEPFGWVINQSLSTLDVHDPVLVSRKRHE